MRRDLLLSLMVLIVGASSLAGQQDVRPDLSRLTLEDLLNVHVISASHLEEPANAAPSTVYVITSEEINRLGLRDLKDILALIPGVDAIDPHFFLLGGQRGFMGSFANTLLLINGREMNNLIAGETFISNQFRAGNIRQVEVINGPGSAIYGANALAGVINIITKTASPLDGLEVMASYGSFGTSDLAVAAGTKAIRVSFQSYRSAGEDFSSFLSSTSDASPAAENNAYRRLPDRFGYENDARAISGSLNAEWRGLYGGVELYRNITGRGTSGIQWDYTSGSDQRDLALEYGGLKRDALAGRLRLLAELRHYHESFRGDHTEGEGPLVNPETGETITGGATDADVEAYRGFYSNFAGGGSRRNVIVAQATFEQSARLTLVGGLMSETSRVTAARFAKGEGRDPALGADEKRPEYSNRKRGIWLESQSRFLTGRLIATVGARYDRHQRWGSSFNPRAGLVFRATPQGTLKLMIGEAFREPNVFELQNSFDIGPTTLRTIEAAWNQFFGGSLKNELVAFRNRADDLIVTDFIAPGGISNQGRLRSRGIEDLLRFRAGSWTGFVNTTWTTADLDEPDRGEHRIYDIPRWKSNAGVSYDAGRWIAGVVARHRGEVDTEYHQQIIRVPSYTVFDATVTLLQGRVQLIARNLLDKTYFQPEPRAPSVVKHPQEGREIAVRLLWRTRALTPSPSARESK